MKDGVNAVIFDMDGVLFDTESLALMAALRTSGALGLGLTERDILSTLGMTEALTDERYAGINPAYNPETFWPACDDNLRQLISLAGVPVKPYIYETIKALHDADVLLALCSSSPLERITQYLSLTRLDHDFSAITAGRADVPGKPAPDMYLNTAGLLGIAPGRCIAVEDSPLGLRAARLAGMFTIMVPDLRPYTEDLAPDCDRVLDSLEALPELVAEFASCR